MYISVTFDKSIGKSKKLSVKLLFYYGSNISSKLLCGSPCISDLPNLSI